MQDKLKKLVSISDTFLKDESIGGKLILIAAVLAMVVVNSPLADIYAGFWHTELRLGLGPWGITMDLREWINEGLMAFFFLVVGLEIKREIVSGELRSFKSAILPIGAALGGMVVPALIYAALNHGTDASNGWGIPIATDIAFAVAVLAMLGKRVPLALKIFLLTLAIADDIGAITVIALFYAEIINFGWLGVAILTACGIYLFRKFLDDKLLIVILVGAFLWVATHLSGIHASIVGAVMGLLAPVTRTHGKPPVAERVEKLVLPFTTFLIVPLFAFANAGFVLSTEAFTAFPAIFWGILLGLILGKVVGISLVSWLLLKLQIAELPTGTRLRHIVGVGFIAGIGFTVSIFITELAFAGNEAYIESAKAGIFVASIVSAAIGSTILLAIRQSDSQ